MNQLMLMGMLQAEGSLADDFTRRADAHGAARRRTDANEALQVDAIDIFHHQEMDAARLAGVVSSDDVRMAERADRLHLSKEAANSLRVVQVAVRQDFDGNDLVEIDLPCFVNHAHAAAAKFLLQLVVAQPAGFYGAVEDRVDKLRIFGKADAVIFHLHERLRPLAEVEFNFQQFAQQPVAFFRRGSQQVFLDHRRLARAASLLELVARTVDARGGRNGRHGRFIASVLAHGRVSA